MSRLDQHVTMVRTRLFAGTFLRALAWALCVLSAVVLLNILVDRFFARRLPHWGLLIGIGAGVAVMAAVAYAVWRRPSVREAAIAIDDRLGLKEKYSTALYVRTLSDPFAVAAVRDAESTADNVSLHKRFPVRVPRLLGVALVAALFVWAAGSWLPALNLFAPDQANAHPVALQNAITPANKQLINHVITEIAAMPPMTAADKTIVESAKRTLDDIQHAPTHDAVADQRSASKALKDVEAVKEKVKRLQDQVVQARNETQLMKDLGKGLDETGPLAQAEKDIAKGSFTQAAEDIGKVVDNFDKMKQEDKEKAAKQMEDLKNQLQKMASNPAQQKAIANQLQQMGATPQQLQQLANATQAAANGDPQAQQQVQQIANQMAQTINQNQGLTPQQQKQIGQQVQNMTKQMQGGANAQATAQNMAAAANGLAAAMKAAAQQGAQQQPGQQGQQGQQGGQQGQGMMASANQAGQQGGQPKNGQAGQQPKGNNAGQPGQQNGTQPGQGQAAGANPSGAQQQGGNQPGQQQGSQPGGQQGQMAGGNPPGQHQGGNQPGQQSGGSQPGGQQQGQMAGGTQSGSQPGGQQQSGQPGQQGSSQSGQQQAGGGTSPGGQQPGQMAGGSQPGQQPGPNGQGSQGGGQGQQGNGAGQTMADAKAEMQKQLRDLQDNADNAGEPEPSQPQQPGGDSPDVTGGQDQANAGHPGAPQPGKGGNDQVGPGGARNAKPLEAPFGFVQKVAVGTQNDKGKFNQVRSVKALSENGTSNVAISTIAESAEKDAADEVDQERISRSEQSVVKRYFDDLKQETTVKP